MTITTGLKSLDDLIGGLQPASLTLYAGTSQSGMTTLIDTTVVGAALKNRVPTLLADLESGDRASRIMSAHSGVKLLAFQRDKLTELDAERLALSMNKTEGAPLHHTTSRGIPYLLAEAMETGAKLIAIDGARYVKTGPGQDSDLAAVLIGLKNLAVDQEAAVVVTAPINRDELHPGDGPSLRSLAPEFGLNCDTVVLLKRWGSLNDKETSEPVELIVPKNRYGRCGQVHVIGDYIHARFLDERLDDQQAA
jgi:replicative DNA helicase